MSAKTHFKEIFEKNTKQDPVIDGLRALSVLSIIGFHVLIGIIQVYDHTKATQFVLNMPGYLQPLWHGEKGVDVFFFLSALVIGLSSFKTIDQYNLREGKRFLLKKLHRIYPLFFVALVLYTIAQWSYFGKYFFSNLFFINNLIPGERNIIPVGWFLTVEVQYFVLLPALLLFLRYCKYRGFALSLLFLSSIAACYWVLQSNSTLYVRPITDLFLAEDRNAFSALLSRTFYESNITRYGPFVLGLALSYFRVFYSKKIEGLVQHRGLLVFFLAAGFLCLPTMIPLYDPTSWYYQPFSAEKNLWVFAMSRQCFSVGISLLVLGCWYSNSVFKPIRSFLSFGAWRPLSKLSFPIYLFHFPFIAVAAVVVFGTTNVKEITHISFFSGALIFLLATALTVIFSIPLYIFIERPIVLRNKSNQTMV